MLAEVPTCSVFLATCNKVPGATKQKMAFFASVPRLVVPRPPVGPFPGSVLRVIRVEGKVYR